MPLPMDNLESIMNDVKSDSWCVLEECDLTARAVESGGSIQHAVGTSNLLPTAKYVTTKMTTEGGTTTTTTTDECENTMTTTTTTAQCLSLIHI